MDTSVDKDLFKVAQAVFNKCMGVSPGEKVLIVTDGWEPEIVNALAGAAGFLKHDSVVLQFTPRKNHGEEPPELAAEAMSLADVILMVTSRSLSHTRARKTAAQRGARAASMPMITREIFLRSIDLDYSVLAEETQFMAQVLTEAREVRITTPSGTNLQLNVEHRQGYLDVGTILTKGSSGNLPGGEAFIAPIEGETQGILVFEQSLAGWGKLNSPIEVCIKGGRVASIRGGREAQWLRDTLAENGSSAEVVAELGIGTNPRAVLSGNILEDEKVKGTAHVALGSNFSFGGKNESNLHLDGMLLKPTILADGKEIIVDGVLLARGEN